MLLDNVVAGGDGLMQFGWVKGSPLIRTILVVVAIVASGVGFGRLMVEQGGVVEKKPAVEVAKKEGIRAKVKVVVSMMPSSIELKAGEERVDLKSQGGGFVGEVVIDKKNTVMFLKVACAPAPSGGMTRNFAKLVVEADGKETFVHVFDSAGDIDDFVELPF